MTNFSNNKSKSDNNNLDYKSGNSFLFDDDKEQYLPEYHLTKTDDHHDVFYQPWIWIKSMRVSRDIEITKNSHDFESKVWIIMVEASRNTEETKKNLNFESKGGSD